VKSQWDSPSIANIIENFWESTGSDVVRKMVAEWIGPQTGRFLDLGCGTARMSTFLKGPCYYVGLDGSEEMLQFAKARVPAKQLVLGDLREGLPFPDASFGTALCMEVIRHLTSYDSVLEGLARVVKKRIFIVDVFHDGPESGFGEERIETEVFPNNTWSLSQFLADTAKHFPGWAADVYTFSNGELGIKIEAP